MRSPLTVGLLLASAGSSLACVPGPVSPPDPEVLRYVAIGDSYTIGTFVDPGERWPDQLVRALGPEPPTLRLVANLGVNGATSGDVLTRQIPVLHGHEPGFLSLLVGVNDVVRRVPSEEYEANVLAILESLLDRLPASRIVVVSTPDYTVTPAGADFGDPATQSAGIVRANAILDRLAAERGIAFIDIHDLSLLAAADVSLVAADGLHPSGAQYARWVERIAPVVRGLLRR